MQNNPRYSDVVEEVRYFLQQRLDACLQAGISQDSILVDPGFGFGKTLHHNLRLMNQLQQLEALGVPVLVGVSRKSMIGAVLDRPVDERLFGGLALAVISVQKGASIIRVHDVASTVDALKMTCAVMQETIDQEAE